MGFECHGPWSKLHHLECSLLSRYHYFKVMVIFLGLDRCRCDFSDGRKSSAWWLRRCKDNRRQLHGPSIHQSRMHHFSLSHRHRYPNEPARWLQKKYHWVFKWRRFENVYSTRSSTDNPAWRHVLSLFGLCWRNVHRSLSRHQWLWHVVCRSKRVRQSSPT